MEKEKIAKEMFDELSRIATDSGKPIERREEPLMRAVFEVTYSKVMKAINKEYTSLDINRGVTEENWRLKHLSLGDKYNGKTRQKETDKVQDSNGEHNS